MISRISCLLSFMQLACVPHPDDEPMFENLSGYLEHISLEVEAMEQRRDLREILRKRGQWYCEEGEWPQRWQEFCNTCWCPPGAVRVCTQAGCKWGPRPIKTGRMCRNPEIEPPSFEPPNQTYGPPAMGERHECFDYFENPGIGAITDEDPYQLRLRPRQRADRQKPPPK